MGCKDINEYVNEHLPLPIPWEQKSDETDIWYENPETRESIWKRPDNDVVQAVVSRIKDRTREEILDTLLTKPTRVLIDLLGTPAIQLCFGKDKDSKIKDLEDAAEKDIETTKNVFGVKKRQPKLLKAANITQNIVDMYRILDTLYDEKKDIFEKNKKATNIQRIFRGHKTRRNQAAVWTRHIDGDEIWYVSPRGESSWKLPKGASLIDAAPNTNVEERANAQEQKAKQNNLKEGVKQKAEANARVAANAHAAANAKAKAKAEEEEEAKAEATAKAEAKAKAEALKELAIRLQKEKEQEKDKQEQKQKCFKLLNLCGPPPGWSLRNTKNENELSEAEIKHKHKMNEKQKEQHIAALKLIDEGVDTECAEIGSGVTPLMWAAAFAPEVAKKLIEKGANINKLDKRGASALIYAINSYNTSISLLLIDKGANINISAGTLLNSKVLKTALDFTYADDGYVYPQLNEVRKKLVSMGAKTAATLEMQKKRKDMITYAENSTAFSAELEEIKKNLEDAKDSEEKATMALRMTRGPKNAARATLEKARAVVTDLGRKLEATIAAWKRKYPNTGGSRRIRKMRNKTRRLR